MTKNPKPLIRKGANVQSFWVGSYYLTEGGLTGRAYLTRPE